ncbi:MAG: hypothetical protein ACLT98_13670 [Eggerthellaceae bacterium]
MNDRYQTDEHRDQTRKERGHHEAEDEGIVRCASSPPQDGSSKKAEQEGRTSEADRDRSAVLQPAHAEYKHLRKIWWGL